MINYCEHINTALWTTNWSIRITIQILILAGSLKAVTLEYPFLKYVFFVSMLLTGSQVTKRQICLRLLQLESCARVPLASSWLATSDIICFEKSSWFLVSHDDVLLLIVIDNDPLWNILNDLAHLIVKSLIIAKLNELMLNSLLAIIGREC